MGAQHRAACRLAVAVVLALGLAAAGGPARAAAADGLTVFGTVGVRSASLKPFPKWTGMLERHFESLGRQDGDCDAGRFNRCHLEDWRRLVDELDGRPEAEQLAVVNAFMNRNRYIVDPINWGVDDYWSTPREFLARFGDCEDYAIAKYFTLLALGIPESRLRVVVVQDLNLRVPHAVLAVIGDGGVSILDNQIRAVVRDTTIRHYRPYYAINGEAWWLQRPDGG